MCLRTIARNAVGALAGAIILAVAVDGYVDTIDPRAGRPTPTLVAKAIVGEGGGASAEAEEPSGPQDPISLIAAATSEAGEKAVKACAACHTFEEGGPNRVGPNLYNVVGKHKAHLDTFAYSDAMKAASEEIWTYENLWAFLENPKGYLPGTKMAFQGLKDPATRAAAIAHLRELTIDPPPLEPPAEDAATEAATEEMAPAEAAPTDAMPEDGTAAEAAMDEARDMGDAEAAAESMPEGAAPLDGAEGPVTDAPGEQGAVEDLPAETAPAAPAN